MRRYGQWAGNPEGMKEDTARCVVSITDRYVFGQCARKRGHGNDGLFCKQHAKMQDRGRRLHVPEDENGEAT